MSKNVTTESKFCSCQNMHQFLHWHCPMLTSDSRAVCWWGNKSGQIKFLWTNKEDSIKFLVIGDSSIIQYSKIFMAQYSITCKKVLTEKLTNSKLFHTLACFLFALNAEKSFRIMKNDKIFKSEGDWHKLWTKVWFYRKSW